MRAPARDRRWLRRAALAAALLVTPPGALEAEELMVFAAASLTDALRAIGRDYEAASGHRVVFSFGASSDLARQIRAGAPADVFFSADRAQVDGLERAGLVRASERVDALSNTLVVVVPTGRGGSVRGPQDLLPLGRIALADPEAVPAGVYARQWLASSGLWPRLRDKVVPTLDVRGALAAVAAAEVDAAVVYRTDLAASGRVRLAFEVPAESSPRVVYCLAPVAGSRRAATADLVRFLVSPGAREVYRRLGFLVIVPD